MTLGATLLGIGAAPAWATPAVLAAESAASTTLPGTLLLGGWSDGGVSTLHAYATAGERVVAALATSDRSGTGARVVVRDPAGTVVHDARLEAGAPIGTELGGAWTAQVDGVWSIAVHDGPGRQAGLTWDVAVEGAVGPIAGRVWTESLAIHTPEPTTIAVHAAAPDGAIYRVTLDGYDGVDSTLRMNDVGNAAAGACEPAHRSVPMSHSPEAGGAGTAWWQPTSDDCDDLTDFRLFLDAPAADLPASTTAWADGRTEETWLSAEYVSPTIAGLAFVRDGPGANAGVVSGELRGQPGVVRVEVDADGDGAFDGPRDVVDEVAVLEPGAFSWRWDGHDAAGSPVPTSATRLTIRASMAQVSPIHFLRIDAETSAGGIEVEALTGPQPGVATLHWDDTALVASSDARWTRTDPLMGSDPATTSAGGVHGWEAGGEHPNQNDGVGGSWGDLRSIDDWASIVDHAEATIAVEALPDVRIDKRVDAEAVVAGDGSAATVVWTIEVGNLGLVAATDLSVVDGYPAALDPASLQVVAGPTQGAIDLASGTWTVGTLPPGATASVSLQGTVSTTPGTAATVVNVARVTGPQLPPPTGSCIPNEGLEADDDRCDSVGTPLEPTPTPTTEAAPPAPVSDPPLRSRGRPEPEPLPQTGADLDGALAVGGAATLALGLAAIVWHRRRARSRSGAV
ncbi:DUF11 domain-containing protein [Agrococcus sp. SGAir0287]|uniref:DUF11 domain-containing protein n=1 Tax=Agrococcus sp. SGAir0287 TaxID=2070347 RepID=UPI0010CCDD9A|nr:DUF11 domain-containing protein [Agrococcus sp. SGAir0287]QCR18184.1 hypothetical protein C1N71_00930 [Agrococcus sp. SGAir0287]